MNLQSLSRAELSTLMADRLQRYYSSSGHSGQRPSFFWLPGQDPFEFTSPAPSLVSCYRQADDTGRRLFRQSLQDLAGMRQEHMPLPVLSDLLLVVGGIGAPDALLTLVRVMGARGDLGHAAFQNYGTAIQVAKGFVPNEAAWDAAREMAGHSAFPPKLVFDVFEAGMADANRPWHLWFETLERMMWLAAPPSRRPAVIKRLKEVAREMSDKLSDIQVERGLKALLGDDVLEHFVPHVLWAEDPRTMLYAALTATSGAPFEVVPIAGRLAVTRKLPGVPARAADGSHPRPPAAAAYAAMSDLAPEEHVDENWPKAA